MTKNALSQTLDQAWACLTAGAAPGKSRFSMVQIASIGLDGAPRARTVVVRGVDAGARALAFHTDRRSPKVAELTADPRVSVIGYDMEAGLQVRIEGAARLHMNDDVALAAWAGSRNQSRICYRSDFAPGEALDDPGFGDPKDIARKPEDEAMGFEHFCRVVIDVAKIDWLDLAASGHRRAVHSWTGDGWRSVWVAP